MAILPGSLARVSLQKTAASCFRSVGLPAVFIQPRRMAMSCHGYRLVAMVVGKAHAPQMSSATRTQWRDGLGHNRSANLDAPNWLWSSIVELVASHEVASLEHCRRYAVDPESAA
jgi:uncharacterized protein (DUF2252 family)